VRGTGRSGWWSWDRVAGGDLYVPERHPRHQGAVMKLWRSECGEMLFGSPPLASRGAARSGWRRVAVEAVAGPGEKKRPRLASPGCQIDGPGDPRRKGMMVEFGPLAPGP